MSFWEKFKEFDKMMSEPAFAIRIKKTLDVPENRATLCLMEENKLLVTWLKPEAPPINSQAPTALISKKHNATGTPNTIRTNRLPIIIDSTSHHSMTFKPHKEFFEV